MLVAKDNDALQWEVTQVCEVPGASPILIPGITLTTKA